MKIGYFLIDSPFKYHLSYLNDNLEYKAPSYKSITLFGTLVRGTIRTPSDNPLDINLSIPIDKSGTGGFNYTLKVTTVFDNVVTSNKTSAFSVEQIIHTYQTQVLQNFDFQSYWNHATEETQDIKNDDGTYKPNAFHKV